VSRSEADPEGRADRRAGPDGPAPDRARPESGSRVSYGSRLWRELRTIPNLISLSRIGLIYIAASLILVGWPITAVLVGLCAGITDYLDGYFARRLGQTTELGAILDRLSDLIFESTWIIVAVYIRDFSPFILYAYLLRELVVVSARLYCSAHGVTIPSTFAGKLKSNFFGYTAFALYLAHSPHVAPVRVVLETIAAIGIFGGLVLSYWSAYDYLKVFARAYDEHSGS
jgi:CDP-diacylglycerol--glycerol-3-phosphate 3-phosphatidyltransferase